MSPEISDEARPWLDQSVEDLRAARHLATDPEVPARLAAFLAHLSAEKALKGALIARGIATRKVHDLVALQAALLPADAAVVSAADVDLLNPWNIEGRYPADLGDADEVLAMATIDAADRIVTALRYSILGRAGA